MSEENAVQTEGTWVSVPCWHNCGGRCLVKALVVNGRVVRTKTDDTHPDTWERPQSRACPMGYAMRQQVYGPDRLRFPMKRKHWEPHTGGDKGLRGRDEWVRISWDEALDIVADELRHAKENYGNSSIFYMNMVNLDGWMGGVLSAFGGYVDCSGTQSTGTFGFHPEMLGFQASIQGSQSNDRMDLVNSDYVVLYGHNPAWASFGNPNYYLKHAKEAGVKFVAVGPDYSASAGFLNAEWIPVRPGEDTALLLGTAYAMLERDEDGSHVDWDFLDRCTVGFDADHMPADAKTPENFRGYLAGEYDGVPKTPEWASAKCGTPVELIYRFADVMSRKNNVAIHSAAAPARNKGSENFPQILMTIACMGGHFGKPGNGCSNDQYYNAFNSSGAYLTAQPLGGPVYRFTNAANPIDDVLNTDSMWDDIINGWCWYAGGNFPGQPQVPLTKRDVDIHVIVSEAHNFLQSQANIGRGIEAFRKVDFVVANAYVLKMDAKYADVVLPIPTKWEEDSSLLYPAFGKDSENLFAWKGAIEPLYDTKSDYEIAYEIGRRLGLDVDAIYPKSDRQVWFEQMAQSAIPHADGTVDIVPTITQEDIDRYGVEWAPQEGMMPLEEFLERGVVRVERAEGGADRIGGPIPYAAFREDPEGNPLASASGKFEIYCQAMSDWFDMVNGYSEGGSGQADFVKVSPLPKYLEHPFGYVEAQEGPYPVQMTHSHYLRRAHTDCDSLPWLREAFTNPVFVNAEDAAERGIGQGDVVKVFNDQGAFLRPASVTPTVMRGCIIVPHGATARIDEEADLDLAGADNFLTPSNRSTTPYLNAWNSTLVQYEKYDGPIELAADAYADPIVPTIAE